MLYLDTSAFLKLYVREDGSDLVQKLISAQSDPLPVWEILEMELYNALQLKVFWKELSLDEATRQQSLFQQRKIKGMYYVPEIARAEWMADFRKLAAFTPELGCRTLDIIHVAFACQLKPSGFLSFDAKQMKLAKAVGLPVIESLS